MNWNKSISIIIFEKVVAFLFLLLFWKKLWFFFCEAKKEELVNFLFWTWFSWEKKNSRKIRNIRLFIWLKGFSDYWLLFGPLAFLHDWMHAPRGVLEWKENMNLAFLFAVCLFEQYLSWCCRVTAYLFYSIFFDRFFLLLNF